MEEIFNICNLSISMISFFISRIQTDLVQEAHMRFEAITSNDVMLCGSNKLWKMFPVDVARTLLYLLGVWTPYKRPCNLFGWYPPNLQITSVRPFKCFGRGKEKRVFYLMAPCSKGSLRFCCCILRGSLAPPCVEVVKVIRYWITGLFFKKNIFTLWNHVFSRHHVWNLCHPPFFFFFFY